MNNCDKIKKLLDKGVKITNPQSLEFDDEINIDRISGKGVTIYSGCKIYGSSTLILDNVKIGYESPVTIRNCQIGQGVALKGGFFNEAVFLDKVTMGYGSHVREGTIIEEEASTAHTVGLKQTILFPFVTLGSLINFCDCLMAGGTSRKNHSEVGSSYIHFNFTPNQDKATASILGDVPNGVMLNQAPIFLGGQGGLVGPCRLAFGTVTAAGTICRKDELRPSYLIFESIGQGGRIPYSHNIHQNIRRIVTNNLIYIANLMALNQWYNYVRFQFISDSFPEFLLDGLKEKLNMGIDERIKRLGEVCNQIENWQNIKIVLSELKAFEGEIKLRDSFLEYIYDGIKISGKDYLKVIQSMDKYHSEYGTLWLQGIVDNVKNKVLGEFL